MTYSSKMNFTTHCL